MPFKELLLNYICHIVALFELNILVQYVYNLDICLFCTRVS